MHALFLWPLLVFDTFENTCAELFPSMLLDQQAMAAAAKDPQPDVTERGAREFAADDEEQSAPPKHEQDTGSTTK